MPVDRLVGENFQNFSRVRLRNLSDADRFAHIRQFREQPNETQQAILGHRQETLGLTASQDSLVPHASPEAQQDFFSPQASQSEPSSPSRTSAEVNHEISRTRLRNLTPGME
jgi:hypothetical protein